MLSALSFYNLFLKSIKKRKPVNHTISRFFLKQLATVLSGWQDSNLRPPAPKAGAITELRYTPKKIITAERQGLEPWHRSLDDSLANCSITTLAPLQAQGNVSCFAVANLRHLYVIHNFLESFFYSFLPYLQKCFTINHIE